MNQQHFGTVYIVRIDDTPFYKIGVTIHRVENRMASIFGVTCPLEISTIHAIDTNNTYRLESDLHRRFNDKRVGGEFFALGAQDVSELASLPSTIRYTQPKERRPFNGVYVSTSERYAIIERRLTRYRATARAIAARTGVHWFAINPDDVWSEITSYEKDIDDLLSIFDTPTAPAPRPIGNGEVKTRHIQKSAEDDLGDFMESLGL